MSKIDREVVFGYSLGQDGKPGTIIVGIPRAAWRYMRRGKTHGIDLSKVGVPL